MKQFFRVKPEGKPWSKEKERVWSINKIVRRRLQKSSFFFFSFNLLNRESVKFLAMSKSMRFKIDFFGPFEIYFAFGCREKKRAKEIFFSQFSVCGGD